MLALAITLGCSENDSSEEARRAPVVTALDTLAAELLEDRPADAAAYMERLHTYLVEVWPESHWPGFALPITGVL